MNSWASSFDMDRMLREFAELKQEVEDLRKEITDMKNKQAEQLWIEAPLTGGFTPRNRSITV